MPFCLFFFFVSFSFFVCEPIITENLRSLRPIKHQPDWEHGNVAMRKPNEKPSFAWERMRKREFLDKMLLVHRGQTLNMDTFILIWACHVLGRSKRPLRSRKASQATASGLSSGGTVGPARSLRRMITWQVGNQETPESRKLPEHIQGFLASGNYKGKVPLVENQEMLVQQHLSKGWPLPAPSGEELWQSGF